VTDFFTGLYIIDVSTPSSPQEAGFLELFGFVYGVAVSGNYAYVTSLFTDLFIIDVSTPSSPQEVGFFDTGDLAYGVTISNSYAYVADGGDGLRIIDVSTPSSPQEVGFFDTGGRAYGVTVIGSFVYVADGSDGLRIIDVSSPSSPQEVGFFDTGGSAFGVTFDSSFVYLADGEAGMYIIQNDLIVSIYEESNYSPKSFSLAQNYPNPFNPSTIIKFSLSSTGLATLKIYNALGEEVAELLDKEFSAGVYEVAWNAIGLPSGVYFYALKVEDKFFEVKKMLLLK